ncbi:MAG: hypothetical protein R3F01_12615 [Lysobacteraceae bacterium]
MPPVLVFVAAVMISASSADVPDAVVMAVLDHESMQPQTGNISYCLRIGDNDPSEALLASIRERFPYVVADSACVVRHGRVSRKSDEAPAIKMTLGSFNQARDHHATLVLSSRAGPRSGGRWQFNLVSNNNVWQVESREMLVVY